MTIVEKALRATPETMESAGIRTVWVDTWQYDQFALGDTLAASLIGAINDELAKPGGQGASAALLGSLKRIISAASLGLAVGVARTFVPAAVDVVEGAAAAINEHRAAADVGADAAAAIAGLHKEFAKVVEETGQRVVVFVDDLDRLRPQRAVEVMEAIKLFLDVPNCVFALAIDFDVVQLGVQQKYGAAVDRRKARAFFDKMIQVPFHMPVAAYELESIFTDLESVLAGDSPTASAPTGAQIRQLVDIARAAVSTNPRATKRLLNTFLLLRSVLDEQGVDEGGIRPTDEQLFAVLSLQVAYPEAYAALSAQLAQTADGDAKTLPLPVGGDPIPQGWSLTDEEALSIRPLLALVNAAFIKDKRFCLEEFRSAMGSAAVTSAGAAPASSGRQTIRDAGERRRQLRGRNVSDSLIVLAEGLAATLAPRGFTIGGYTTSNTWSIYLPPNEDGSGSKRIAAQVRFSSTGLQVDFCSASYIADVETAARQLLDRLRRELAPAASGSPTITYQDQDRLRVRVTGLTTTEQIDVLAPILIDLSAASRLSPGASAPSAKPSPDHP